MEILADVGCIRSAKQTRLHTGLSRPMHSLFLQIFMDFSKLLHLAQRFSRSALLGFLLVASLARAVDRIVNAHGKLKSLVVVGSRFRQKLVGDLAVDMLLHDFLQGRLVVFHVLAAVDGQKLIA